MSLYSAPKFQDFLKQELENLSPSVVDDIRSIISDLLNEPDLHLEVAIQSDKLDSNLPIAATLYRQAEEIKTWEIASTVSEVLSQKQLETLQKFDQAGVEITEVTLQSLIEWFADCWEQANDGLQEIAAQISIYDDIEAFDLNRREWIRKEVLEKQSRSPETTWGPANATM